MSIIEKAVMYFCIVILSMFAGIVCRFLFVNWFNRHYQPRRSHNSNLQNEIVPQIELKQDQSKFQLQQASEAERQEKVQIHVNNYKLVKQQNDKLEVENTELRAALEFKNELRADLLRRSIQMEDKILYLNRELYKAQQTVKSFSASRDTKEAVLQQAPDKIDPWEQLLSREQKVVEYVELEIEPDAIIHAKGVSVEEMFELKNIMEGNSKSTDLDSVVIVAKMENTIMYDQFMDNIKDSKQNIASLIDRIDQKRQGQNDFNQSEQAHFYENTGFNIENFLPTRSA